nr:hypothetical protein [uncultured Treponema sp.]
MVLLSGTLRFVQESRSGNTAEKLLAMITTTCTVTRRNRSKIELPLDEVVPGDIIHLSSCDMIPCDVRILEAKDFFVSESTLTGESEDVEKTFSKDVNSVSWVLICFRFVMVPVVFVVNGITKGDWLKAFFCRFNNDDFRLLALAHKTNPSPVGKFSVEDEKDMVLLGYLALLDPPKESTAEAIRALKNHGVEKKILTGDSEKVTRTICRRVGLKVSIPCL